MEQNFKVPIRNLFIMLSYSNDMPEMIREFRDVDEDLITYDLLAKMFLQEAEGLFNRGLIRNYVTHQEETGFISGRMRINESISFIAEKKPVVVCEKDAYSPNILLNQIMKTTLKNLVQNRHIEEKTRKECHMLWEKMPDVEDLWLAKEVFSRMTFSRHDAHYKRMVHLARLLYELQLLSHNRGDWSLYAVPVTDTELNRLFEKFLFHFYRLEQSIYRVKSERLDWNLTGNQALLPSMLTDVSLLHRKEQKKIIIDAKFYKHMFQVHHDKRSFHSGNMYQMFTYLHHQPKELENLRGILVYPFNGHEIHEVYLWDERVAIEVMTVNLAASWRDIYEELMQVVDESVDPVV
ncbi:McrC family protein [Virgibacillus sp. W0181]|uniref:McrC family protein n=1 Tax=Virgibacillus sp. W0181 TaxID=3391581 RepID=UPI003F47C8D7